MTAPAKPVETVLVTGHAGYLGRVMTPLILEAGHRVIGLDTCYFDDPFSAEAESFPALRKDVRDVTVADLKGVTAIAHLAALCNDPLGDLNPELTHEINHRATVRLARIARDVGIHRFLYASSCSMYGAGGDDLATEEAPLRPLTAYAGSKVRAEEDLATLADSRFSPVFLRNATAFGWSPRLRADVVLNNLACWAHTTGKIRIMSDGTPWRPIVHARDIAAAFIASLEAPRDVVHNQAFNVGSNEANYQVRDIAEVVKQAAPGCEVTYSGTAGPDARNYRVDFSKIARSLPAFQPMWNALRGAQEVLYGCRTSGMTLEQFQSRRYVRLTQFKHLLATGQLNSDLRWAAGVAQHA